MQRLNRSAHAPLGRAFLLFLGLAILPVSLRAAGLRVSFSPSLSAAIDAWQQIADVFGAGYQPAGASNLSVRNDSAGEPLKAVDSGACRQSLFACAREIEQVSVTLQDVSNVRPAKAGYARGGCPRAASRTFAGTTPLEPNITPAATKASLEKLTRALEALSAIKLETETREELLKSIEKHMVERSFEAVKNLAIPRGLRVLVQVKRPTIPSATKPAECKVRAALASARRLELERAMLTSMPFTSPDNCEF